MLHAELFRQSSRVPLRDNCRELVQDTQRHETLLFPGRPRFGEAMRYLQCRRRLHRNIAR
jgi:hypothetical protein